MSDPEEDKRRWRMFYSIIFLAFLSLEFYSIIIGVIANMCGALLCIRCQSIRFRYRFWWCGENLICIWHRCVRSVYCVLPHWSGLVGRCMDYELVGWMDDAPGGGGMCSRNSYVDVFQLWKGVSKARWVLGNYNARTGCWNCQWIFLLLAQNTWQDFIRFDCAVHCCRREFTKLFSPEPGEHGGCVYVIVCETRQMLLLVNGCVLHIELIQTDVWRAE